MPHTIITSQDAKSKGLFGGVGQIVWIDKVQWVFAGQFRWVL